MPSKNRLATTYSKDMRNQKRCHSFALFFDHFLAARQALAKKVGGSTPYAVQLNAIPFTLPIYRQPELDATRSHLNMQLRIAHLYAHFLNIYGDRGNIIALSQRAHWRGIEVKVEAIDLNQKADPDFTICILWAEGRTSSKLSSLKIW